MNKQIRLMICSNAGGSGKTTVSVHLAYELSKRNLKATIIELDYSASISSFTGLGLNPSEEESVASVLAKSFKGEYPTQDIWTEYTDKVNVIQGGEALRDRIREIPTNARGHYVLADKLSDYPIDSDVIIFDTPASLEPMGVLALAASTHLLSPIKPEIKDAQGLFGLLRWYETTADELRLNPKPKILGFVPMRVDYSESVIHRDVLGVNKKGERRKDIDWSETLPGSLEEIDIRCFPLIKDSKNYLRACSEGKPLGIYRPKSPAANDFNIIADAIKSEYKEL